jgi:aryl sulfotransferase
VVPWDILALDCGQNLDDEQKGACRAFKSHEAYKDIVKGAKYIYVSRHPMDAFVSFHHFLPRFMNLKAGDLSMAGTTLH